ncbi:MAG: hypothetical protein LBQ56_01910 [Synergistaceae bacterium]|jgi:hypothetical protein|nr:hypothetical protein [Synergistaceae bacterium]
MPAKLKIFLQGEACMPGCGWCRSHRGTERDPLPDHVGDAAKVRALIRAIKERYGPNVDISVKNPWSILTTLDCFRYDISPAKPVWVLERKKIYEGVPELDDLLEIIDRELQMPASPLAPS